ncbi:MAG: hypothetical protein IJS15_05225 [Victivallales bacterium]|nr:hypothetical protein [Victivallales bacterium]
MIPSDHFVRFYNEVFKFLDAKGGLAKYYQTISAHQEFHCLKAFSENGLQGVYDYYQKIYKEENCVGHTILKGHELELYMGKCPSLSKALDNDAGACPKYCMHCPGWTQPLYTKAGLFQIYDLMGLDNPQCCEWIFDDLEAARAKYRKLLEDHKKEDLIINFEP